MPVSVSQRADLERTGVSTLLPHRQVVQARGLLWASDGVANEEIVRRCDVDSDTVRRSRSRFAEQGAGRVGRIGKELDRKPSLRAGAVEEVLRLIGIERPAAGSTHRRTRGLAAPCRHWQRRRHQNLGRSQFQAVEGRDFQDQQCSAL
jgi:hypothetical protein